MIDVTGVTNTYCRGIPYWHLWNWGGTKGEREAYVALFCFNFDLFCFKIKGKNALYCYIALTV